MQSMLDLLESEAIDKDTTTLDKFYESVRKRASGIDNAQGRQKIIIELYDKFFKTAFPKMVEQLGIVYTPVEVVDFIIHSVEDVLKKEFDRSLTDQNIHILDPFTGTGTFMTRLLQSGLIQPKDLPRKYKSELHANEIVLLAYYIAAINIENTYHDIMKDSQKDQEFQSFEGIVLTDTFQMGETEDGEHKIGYGTDIFEQNSDRINKQKKAPLRVIIGNPPYSIGQKSANDNAQNQSYPKLDNRIATTYAQNSNAGLSKSLYDAYIKAFRWSSDKLDPQHGGIIAFITNSGWIDGNSTDGFRKSLENEFSSIYVFNLRGAIRGRSGESAKKEGQNVFDIMTGVAITILVKKPKNNNSKCTINYYDIGDYMRRGDKLDFIKQNKIETINWNTITPNPNSDWINERNDIFSTFIPIEPTKKFDHSTQSFFVINCPGILSSRDAWVYNFANQSVENNMTRMIDFYNRQKSEYQVAKQANPNLLVENFIDTNPTKISWTRALRGDLDKNIIHSYKKSKIQIGSYRPFCKQVLYFDRPLIESPGLSDKLFPTKNTKNVLITIPGSGSIKDFYAFAVNTVRDYDTYGGCQCFPLYYYEQAVKSTNNIFDSQDNVEYNRRDGISDFILQQAKIRYGNSVTKEDIFYYVYGFLHSPDYRIMFANDLKKMLPKLPLVDMPSDFWKFSKTGRQLANLHINYEEIEPLDSVIISGAETQFYDIQKMRYAKNGKETVKTTIYYNSQITISNIPLRAYDYTVNGKSAIDWIMERYQISTHKDSGIMNNPNDWATEHDKPRYILDLLLSVINLSIQTVELVESLPKVELGK